MSQMRKYLMEALLMYLRRTEPDYLTNRCCFISARNVGLSNHLIVIT